jgi:hypothetical protein
MRFEKKTKKWEQFAQTLPVVTTKYKTNVWVYGKGNVRHKCPNVSHCAVERGDTFWQVSFPNKKFINCDGMIREPANKEG